MQHKYRVEVNLDTDGYLALHEFLRAHGKGLFVIEFLGETSSGSIDTPTGICVEQEAPISVEA